MSPPVAAIIQEMITIGVILASNSTPADGADAENPPPAMTTYQNRKKQTTNKVFSNEINAAKLKTMKKKRDYGEMKYCALRTYL